jgi:hypothetical protein
LCELTATVLSPHFDDAVLSVWHLVGGPGEVAVLNVFGACPRDHDGSAWWDRLTGATDSVARFREREAEDRAALALAGRTGDSLPFLEGQYRTGEQPLEPLAAAIAARTGDGPVYAPAALDGHRSHRLTRAAGLELRRRGTTVRLYADLPHALVFGWPEWVTGATPDPLLSPQAEWDRELATMDVAPGEPRVERLSDGELARKLEAVGCYRTQLPALEAQFGPLRSDDRLRYEVFWEMPPP